MRDPSGHHDGHGDLTIQIGHLDPNDPTLRDFVRDIHTNVPHEGRDFDDPLAPTAVWVAWPYARQVVERLRATWPDAPVTAAANPNYGKADELAVRLGEALAAIKAAEELVREGAERVGGAA